MLSLYRPRMSPTHTGSLAPFAQRIDLEAHAAPGLAVYAHPTSSSVTADADIIAVHAEAKSHKPFEESRTMDPQGVVTLTGHELLCPVAIPPAISGVTSTVPQGGVLAMVPANLRFLDGSRIAALLSTYDQFCIKRMIFHYTQATNLTQSGQLLLAYVNDPDDKIWIETGFTALRDAYSRNGAVLSSVRADCSASLDKPLLKWYFTGTDGLPMFELPGYIGVFNMLDFSNATASSIPLGTLSVSYEIAVRSPSAPTALTTQYMTNSTSIGSIPAIAVNTAVTMPIASFAANLCLPDVVYWGTVVSCDDVAVGNASWRTWRTPDQQANPIVMQPGNLLFWRTNVTGATVYFFPTFEAAASASVGPGGYLVGENYWTSIAVGGFLRGFKLWNIMGVNVSTE